MLIRIQRMTISFLILWLFAFSTWAAPDQPKIGLALSGGGARGAAHVGVLKLIEELGVRIDYVAGTSMGSAVGGLYASGYSASEIEVLLSQIDWIDAFNDDTFRPNKPFRRKQDDTGFLVKAKLGFKGGEPAFPLGLVQGQQLEQVLGGLTASVVHITDFDDLPIPFRAVATELSTGEAISMGQGNLATAIRASMSVPGVFAPTDPNERLLVDGGLAQNLPVETVKEMGADIVIAVDISTPLYRDDELTSVIAITEQLTSLLTVKNAKRSRELLGAQDILIVPELEGISSADFTQVLAAVPRGLQAAEQHRESLIKIAQLAPAQPNSMSNALLLFPSQPLIEFVEIVNQSRLSDEVLLSRLNLQLNQPLDRDALDEAIDRLYGLDVFQKVSYELINRDQQTGIQIKAQEKSWGPDYLQFGLALSDDFAGGENYSLGFAYTRTALNPLGGEARFEFNLGRQIGLAADWYQPLDVSDRYFFNPQLLWGRADQPIFESDGDRLGEVQFSIYSVGLDAGYHPDDNSEFRLGVEAGQVDIDQLSGLIDESQIGRFDLGELTLSYEYDSFDSLNFPSRGLQAGFLFRSALESLGSEDTYDQLSLNFSRAKTWNDHTVLSQFTVNTTLDDDAPVYRLFSLGGFGQLSGFQESQISGQHSALVSAAYYRRFRELSAVPLYAGASVEWGNVWQDRSDASIDNGLFGGSVFIGADTFFGPFYLGYGLSEGNTDSFFMFLGNPFNNRQ